MLISAAEQCRADGNQRLARSGREFDRQQLRFTERKAVVSECIPAHVRFGADDPYEGRVGRFLDRHGEISRRSLRRRGISPCSRPTRFSRKTVNWRIRVSSNPVPPIVCGGRTSSISADSAKCAVIPIDLRLNQTPRHKSRRKKRRLRILIETSAFNQSSAIAFFFVSPWC